MTFDTTLRMMRLLLSPLLRRAGRRVLAALVALVGLLLAGTALGSTISFNGGAVSNCTYSSGNQTYTCSAISTSSDITVSSGYSVVVPSISAASLTTSSSVNISGAVSVSGAMN